MKTSYSIVRFTQVNGLGGGHYGVVPIHTNIESIQEAEMIIDGMFKDTSLLALFSLFELTGISRSILSQPEFLGRNAEVYLFIGCVYWAFCAAMSLVSRQLEVK